MRNGLRIKTDAHHEQKGPCIDLTSLEWPAPSRRAACSQPVPVGIDRPTSRANTLAVPMGMMPSGVALPEDLQRRRGQFRRRRPPRLNRISPKKRLQPRRHAVPMTARFHEFRFRSRVPQQGQCRMIVTARGWPGIRIMENEKFVLMEGRPNIFVEGARRETAGNWRQRFSGYLELDVLATIFVFAAASFTFLKLLSEMREGETRSATRLSFWLFVIQTTFQIQSVLTGWRRCAVTSPVSAAPRC